MAPNPPEHPFSPADRWRVSESSGPAGAFHARPLPDPAEALVWIHRVPSPALVLGSTQDASLIRADETDRAEVEVARRRSGGGLVVLRPENDLWVDVIVPKASALWDDDVGRAFQFLGEAWAAAIGDTVHQVGGDHPRIEVHRGAPEAREAGRVLCFAGLGAGEVTVDGHKVVGISQRRTRLGARFQSVMTWRWDPAFLEPLIQTDRLEGAGIELGALAIGLPERILRSSQPPTVASVLPALLTRLPHPQVSSGRCR